MTSPADHVATVRRLCVVEVPNWVEWDASLTALVALAERATELERERDDLKKYRDAETRALAERAEQLETALRRIVTKPVGEPPSSYEIARAALGETVP